MATGLLSNQSANKIPPDILRRLLAGEDVPGYVVDKRPVQVQRGTGYGVDAEFMNDPSGAMTTLIYKTTGRNTWKSNGDTAEVYDADGNFVGVSSGDSNALSLAKFIASSVAAGYGANYANGLEAAGAGGGMGTAESAAFLEANAGALAPGGEVAAGYGSSWGVGADGIIGSGATMSSSGASLSGAEDLVGGDLVDMTADGVQFGGGGEEAVGNGLKTNASSFGPNYSNAAAGGAGGGGGGSLFSNLMSGITGGDLLKIGLGVAGIVVNNNTARDLAAQNRIDQKDLLDTKNDQEINVLEKKDEISDENKADDRAYDKQQQKELWARMMPVNYQRLELKAIPGAQPPTPTLNAAQPNPSSAPGGFEGGGYAIHNAAAPPGMRWDPATNRFVTIEDTPPAGGGLLNQPRRFG